MQKILDRGMTVMQIKVEIAICVSILNFEEICLMSV